MKFVNIYTKATVSNTVGSTKTTIITEYREAHFPYGSSTTIQQYLLIKAYAMRHRGEADKVEVVVTID